eukprot:TRINITY_DN4757_c0_g1_i1.p1 TRINITY_DN4757_c0_g1~~TRINITY_DN4757_c0_g1_i1.p1  ORF type:complete len:823 (+),score=231.08 TRINITY_DN4757_c0_g1_i1:89-2470(+)
MAAAGAVACGAESDFAALLRAGFPATVPAEKVLHEIVPGSTAAAPCVHTVPPKGPPELRPCAVLLTSFRFVCVYAEPGRVPFELPLMAIDGDVPEPRRVPSDLELEGALSEELVIVTKLPWDLRIAFRRQGESRGLWMMMRQQRKVLSGEIDAAIGAPIEQMFAFEHCEPYRQLYPPAPAGARSGWQLHDQKAEMQRQLAALRAAPADGPPVRLCDAEAGGPDSVLSPVAITYPTRFAVPRRAPDSLVAECAKFRSRGRLPVVSWLHPATCALLSRAAQPLAGLGGKRSEADEQLVELCGNPLRPAAFSPQTAMPQRERTPGLPPSPPWGGAPPPLVIYDARSHITAQANRSRGGGTEGQKNYRATVHFLEMENIHSVSAAYRRLKRVLEAFSNNASNAPSRDLVPGTRGPNTRFWEEWDRTGWPLHIQRLLWGAMRIAEDLGRGTSVLVHCSDGGTVMLLLDPHFRTVRGFCTLIDREWCEAGHKFAERCGHQVQGRFPGPQLVDDEEEEGAEPDSTPSSPAPTGAHGGRLQPAPIFLQWIDAVWQILRQLPNDFEFTPLLLELIVDNLWSCRWGTFLCNSDRERRREGIKERTVSLWEEVDRLVELERQGASPLRLLNPQWRPPPPGAARALCPSCNARQLRLWEAYYLRHDGDAVHVANAHAAAAADSGQRLRLQSLSQTLAAAAASGGDAARAACELAARALAEEVSPPAPRSRSGSPAPLELLPDRSTPSPPPAQQQQQSQGERRGRTAASAPRCRRQDAAAAVPSADAVATPSPQAARSQQVRRCAD